jgi:GxxExxY protein
VKHQDTKAPSGPSPWRITILLVGGSVIVEIKAAEKILPVHEAQLLTYLKLSGYQLGFLINFNSR